MALTTRCPQCGAAFRVVADQLRVRNGLVRCGECATVFDGRACLVPAPDAGAPRAA
ncbi:MJ0042-type zinc finger domain-containing protein, partial [Bordetella pertussis]